MKIKVNADECRKDSPLFRASIDAAEHSLSALETKLEKVIKLCNSMVDAGKNYGVANSAFIQGVQDMTSYYAGDPILEKTLGRFAEALTEIQGFHTVLVDLASQSIARDLHWLIRTDLRHVRESQSKFRRASDDLDTALSKHVGAPKNKPAECDEAANQLLVCRSKFTAMSLEYADKLNMFNEKQRHDVLQTMFSYLTAQSTYFHQGHDLFEDDDSFIKDVADKLVELTDLSLALSKESEARRQGLMQTLTDCKQSIIGVDGGDSAAVDEQPAAAAAKVSGFLFRRTNKGFKAWVRRWFSIENNQLIYTKKLSEGWTVMEEDLRLCVVKPHSEGDRRFCFEVKSPARSHILQATDEEECEMWMKAIQAGVVAAYSDRSRTVSQDTHSSLATSASLPLLDNQQKAKTSTQAALLFTIPGNDQCADCSSRDPRWASVNLGITLCIECSGVHRSLGVHISKVRSITLDSWEPEVLKVMAELGNTVVNSIYEYSYLDNKGTVARPSSSSNSSVRETFIKCKYVECRYVRPLVTEDKSATIKRWTVARRQRKTIMLDSMADELLEPASVGSTRGEKTTPNDDEEVVTFGLAVNELIDKFSTDLLDDSSGSEGSEDTRLHTSIEHVERLDPNLLLYKASEARNIPVLLQGLANKADINWKNSSDDSKTSLIKAVESGSLATCEFLLLNSANVDAADSNGQTALHHATLRRHTAQVCQLLKRGADYKHRDKNQLDALMLAMRSEQADIVTLLRVANLRQEMTDADPGSLTDDSLNDIIRDFTHLASNDPDRLRRGTEKYGSTDL